MAHKCKCCAGSGIVICRRCGGHRKFESGDTCYYCKGIGTVTCPACNGKGIINE